MKSIKNSGIIVQLVGLLASNVALSQGSVTYVTSLGFPSAGTKPVASDSWLAAGFATGGNHSGYELDSVELAVGQASGTPSGFTVDLYSAPAGTPTIDLGTLIGSSDPEAPGVYTYTASGLMLLAGSDYAIVVTDQTPLSSGSYALSIETGSWPSGSPEWGVEVVPLSTSSDGSTWSFDDSLVPQYAVNATAVPEPDPLSLIGVSGALFLARRRLRARALR